MRKIELFSIKQTLKLLCPHPLHPHSNHIAGQFYTYISIFWYMHWVIPRNGDTIWIRAEPASNYIFALLVGLFIWNFSASLFHISANAMSIVCCICCLCRLLQLFPFFTPPPKLRVRGNAHTRKWNIELARYYFNLSLLNIGLMTRYGKWYNVGPRWTTTRSSRKICSMFLFFFIMSVRIRMCEYETRRTNARAHTHSSYTIYNCDKHSAQQ